jgi:hypothetical protein
LRELNAEKAGTEYKCQDPEHQSIMSRYQPGGQDKKMNPQHDAGL